MEFAILTYLQQKNSRGDEIADWYSVEIDCQVPTIWPIQQVSEGLGKDAPDPSRGQTLSTVDCEVWVHRTAAGPNWRDRRRLWYRASGHQARGRNNLEAWLRTHGYLPIAEDLGQPQ